MNVVLTVGNSMMGDDGAGPLLAEMMADAPIEGWIAVNGGSTPKTSRIRSAILSPAGW
ncbi:Hydrogenase 3 maturation protease [Serratia fonticola]|uniref:Hydrogenase 3 maturation protease n=1 Tax=Serratia fonticola TaxID=47917 RepID=A0A3S4WY64_SERFO|nr:Hydrogenase 3 maturation protease [Serratia fonticola]